MASANKRAWVWVTASVVVVLLLGGLVFLLLRALGQSGAAATALDAARVRLENYYSRNPFPNHTNVVVEKSNAATMRLWRDDLLHTLSTNQVETPSKTPAQFEIFLTARSKDLRDAAMRNGVRLPQAFSFGFSRYAEGHALPESREDLPTRLAEQLVLVDHVCRLMFEERISELSSVTRDEFAVERIDISGPGPGTMGPKGLSKLPGSVTQPPSAGPTAAAKLPTSAYRKLHFAFELRAREPVLTSLLNRLASDPMFIVVNSVEIESPVDQQLGMQPKKDESTNAVTRVARVVCSPETIEPAQVKIEMDVYRF